jgi:hypothetical protein
MQYRNEQRMRHSFESRMQNRSSSGAMAGGRR